MATKKMDPKNPDTTKKVPKSETAKAIGRKAGRKTNGWKWSDRALKGGIVAVVW